jgi:hypothetical protein
VLRSWIERARASLTPQNRIGLAIGRDYVGMARLTIADGAWQVQDLAHTSLNNRLFSRTSSAQITDSLASAIGSLIGDLKRSYVPIHVSVPDAAVHLKTFELDEVPKSPAEQTAFVGFRFASEGNGEKSVCASQDLGSDGDKRLLLGIALESTWQRCIVEAFKKAGIVAWSLSSNSLRLFDRYYGSFVATSGALVLAAPDSWALLLWDTQRRIRYARARWRTSLTDHAEIATDVERSILAYVHAHPDNAITHIYVSGGQETSALCAALDARLREPSIQLSNDAGLTFAGSAKRQVMSAPLSLAAALEQ